MGGKSETRRVPVIAPATSTQSAGARFAREQKDGKPESLLSTEAKQKVDLFNKALQDLGAPTPDTDSIEARFLKSLEAPPNEQDVLQNTQFPEPTPPTEQKTPPPVPEAKPVEPPAPAAVQPEATPVPAAEVAEIAKMPGEPVETPGLTQAAEPVEFPEAATSAQVEEIRYPEQHEFDFEADYPATPPEEFGVHALGDEKVQEHLKQFRDAGKDIMDEMVVFKGKTDNPALQKLLNGKPMRAEKARREIKKILRDVPNTDTAMQKVLREIRRQLSPDGLFLKRFGQEIEDAVGDPEKVQDVVHGYMESFRNAQRAKRLYRQDAAKGIKTLAGRRISQLEFDLLGGAHKIMKGKTVQSAGDIASLAQALRNPNHETMRLVMVKNGKVHEVQGYSFGLNSATAIGALSPKEARKLEKKWDAQYKKDLKKEKTKLEGELKAKGQTQEQIDAALKAKETELLVANRKAFLDELERQNSLANGQAIAQETTGMLKKIALERQAQQRKLEQEIKAGVPAEKRTVVDDWFDFSNGVDGIYTIHNHPGGAVELANCKSDVAGTMEQAAIFSQAVADLKAELGKAGIKAENLDEEAYRGSMVVDHGKFLDLRLSKKGGTRGIDGVALAQDGLEPDMGRSTLRPANAAFKDAAEKFGLAAERQKLFGDEAFPEQLFNQGIEGAGFGDDVSSSRQIAGHVMNLKNRPQETLYAFFRDVHGKLITLQEIPRRAMKNAKLFRRHMQMKMRQYGADNLVTFTEGKEEDIPADVRDTLDEMFKAGEINDHVVSGFNPSAQLPSQQIQNLKAKYQRPTGGKYNDPISELKDLNREIAMYMKQLLRPKRG